MIDLKINKRINEKLKKLEDIKNAINRPRTGYYCRTGFLGNKIIENFKI